MLQHPWPGNIRELQNKLKSAVILADSKLITADDLGLSSREMVKTSTLRKVREQAETQAIRQAYTLANGNLSKTSDLLGITRPTLYALIDKYRLHDLRNAEAEI
jgi:two-component system NtrC family response regulator